MSAPQKYVEELECDLREKPVSRFTAWLRAKIAAWRDGAATPVS